MLAKNYYINGTINSVSVEDVSNAHIKCLENPELTRNKRYILVEGSHDF